MLMIESARGGGAVTCSSIGRGAEMARSRFDFPVLRVDEAMAEAAVEAGGRVGVAATLETTPQPTGALLRKTVARAGRNIRRRALTPGAIAPAT